MFIVGVVRSFGSGPHRDKSTDKSELHDGAVQFGNHCLRIDNRQDGHAAEPAGMGSDDRRQFVIHQFGGLDGKCPIAVEYSLEKPRSTLAGKQNSAQWPPFCFLREIKKFQRREVSMDVDLPTVFRRLPLPSPKSPRPLCRQPRRGHADKFNHRPSSLCGSPGSACTGEDDTSWGRTIVLNRVANGKVCADAAWRARAGSPA